MDLLILDQLFLCNFNSSLYFLLAKAMNVIPVGFTYATYGGLTITAVTLFGVFKYNQIPNLYGILGIA